MSINEGDIYLIQSVQRGEPQAWRQIIDRYQGRLVSFARRMLAQPAEAEDLVQETFLGLLRSLPNYDRSRSLETYLFAILRNKLHDHFRSTKRHPRQSLDSLDLDDAHESWLDRDTPSDRLDAREVLATQREALVNCLRLYAEQCQEQNRFQELMIVEMLMVLGMRNKEVAADLELTETAVAGVKFRVLERWREIAAQHEAARDWQEADLARDSTVAEIWRDEGISCLKRTTLGRFLLGALDEDWNSYIDFHVQVVGCDRCQANLDDLKQEEAEAPARERLLERCFNSSVGFLSRRPAP